MDYLYINDFNVVMREAWQFVEGQESCINFILLNHCELWWFLHLLHGSEGETKNIKSNAAFQE